MIKRLALILSIFCLAMNVNAQKFAYVDSDYILEKVPEYQSAQEQLDKLTLSWQEEIEQIYQTIDQLYKKYQADQILLTQDMKIKERVKSSIKKKKLKNYNENALDLKGICLPKDKS